MRSKTYILPSFYATVLIIKKVLAATSAANDANAANHVGTGLVEISAVATLFGAPIAEALTVGLRSAAGLPWTSMSAFGLLHVAKAALAAAIPDWLRESMGLQNANVVAALGFCLPLKTNEQARRREDLGDVQAICVTQAESANAVQNDIEVAQRKTKSTNDAFPHIYTVQRSRIRNLLRCLRESVNRKTSEKPHALCIYAMDRTTKLAMDTIPAAEAGKAILVHEFVPDQAGKQAQWKDFLLLGCSLIKLSEIMILWKLGSRNLHLFTAIGWAYGLVSGIFVTILGLSRDRISQVTVDVVAGRLPSALHIGGEGKILTGLPDNVRRAFAWKAAWYMYSLAAMGGVFGTFIELGSHDSKVIYTWIAFQLLWLGVRSIVYYFAESAVGVRQGLLISKSWNETSPEIRHRVLQLCGALSQQQVTIHPRGAKTYQYDLTDVDIMRSRLSSAGWLVVDDLTLQDITMTALDVLDIIGDPVMRTIIWISGEQSDNSDIYDSALAFVKLNSHTIAAPCVRVSVCNCKGGIRMRSRGNSHGSVCRNMVWVLWIPAKKEGDAAGITPDLWIYARGMRINTTLSAEVLTTYELHQRLTKQEWNVSITKVEELDRIVVTSRRSSALVRDFLK